ncbi:hypothetical protein FJ656_35350, partial [Schumannella luteola]
AKARVRSAIGNSGFSFPGGRVTVNLSPASLPKTGSAFDLGIALAVLAAEGWVAPESVAGVVHLGELGLDGRLRPSRGILPMVLAAERAGFDTVLVPVGNADEAALVPGMRVVPVASLRAAAIWHGAELEPVEVEPLLPVQGAAVPDDAGDLAEVIGNRDAVEAVQVAAAGGHHMFLLGPPGAGKTMIATRLPGILPDLDERAAIEVSSIRSLAGVPVGRSLATRPPLEAPHHSASPAAIVGGGSGVIRPGAAARAAHGILFLDESRDTRTRHNRRMEKRAVLYCRVSRSTDESVSTSRQERELRELAAAEGWPVVAVYTDEGVTGTRDRENADAALDAVARGDADALLVWEMSRWSRMGLGAVARLVGVLRDRPGSLFVAKKEGLRSDQPAFGIMAAVVAEVAAMEAEGTRDRILSMRRHVLSATDPAEMRWLGGAVPFGYRPAGRPGGGKTLVPDDSEAQYAREGARRLAAGARITDVTRWLDAEGVATPQSAARRARQAGEAHEGLDRGRWRVTTVRKLFQSPTLIGRTTRRERAGTRADGSPVWEYRAVADEHGMPITRWEPLLDPGTFAAVQERFRTRGPNEGRRAASWLSGLLYCGLCGSVMYAARRDGGRADAFRCANKAFPNAQCPGVSISRPAAEAHMEATILRMVGHLAEYRVSETAEGPDQGELDGVAQAIADVQGALAQDGADYAELLPRLDALKGRRRALLDAPRRTRRTRTPTGRTLAEAWRADDAQARRHLVEDMLDSVTVAKAARGAR